MVDGNVQGDSGRIGEKENCSAKETNGHCHIHSSCLCWILWFWQTSRVIEHRFTGHFDFDQFSAIVNFHSDLFDWLHDDRKVIFDPSERVQSERECDQRDQQVRFIEREERERDQQVQQGFIEREETMHGDRCG